MKSKKPSIMVARIGDRCMWGMKEGSFFTAIEPGACPFCFVENAVTALPAPLLAQQPDDTTHVCNPALGGCNQGFSKTY